MANTGYLTEFDASGQSLTGVVQMQDPTGVLGSRAGGGLCVRRAGLPGFGGRAYGDRRRNAAWDRHGGPGAEILSAALGGAPVTPTGGTYTVGSNGRGTLALTPARRSHAELRRIRGVGQPALPAVDFGRKWGRGDGAAERAGELADDRQRRLYGGQPEWYGGGALQPHGRERRGPTSRM